MRFYDLRLTNAAGQVYQPIPNGNGFVLKTGGTTFSSQLNGMNNPGALDLEADIVTYNAAAPEGNSSIKIHGVGLGMIGQANNLNGMGFILRAGMAKGLPLATAQAPQAGVIAQGLVYRGYGNWQGTDQTLDLIVNAGSLNVGRGIVFNWPAGTPLATALASTLSQAFPPPFIPKISISNLLVQAHAESGFYDTIWQFASTLTELTKKLGASLFGPQYPGVQIVASGNTVVAYDTTMAPATPVKMLSFSDLIGQPTWIEAATISFKTVLRADISPSTQVQFPLGAPVLFAQTATVAAVPGTPASSKTAFQGNFFVHTVHHYMHLRQPDGDSWASVFTASPISLTNN
jgi:hypothetical protein